MTVLVAGATGNVGAELVRTLAASGQDVRGLVRTARAPQHGGTGAGGDVVVADLDDPSSLREALVGVDAAFLLPGYRDMPGLYVELSRAGVERVVQLSGGSAGSRDMGNAVTAYMVRSEDAARDSGLSWTILRPTAFMSNALRWTAQLRAGDVVTAPFAGVRTATVDPADIAAVAATALLDPTLSGQVLIVTGPQPLQPADQVAVLGATLGRSLRFVAQPDDVAREEMSRSTPPEYVEAFFDFYVGGSLDESTVLPTVAEVTGREARTFEQWAAAHRHEFDGPG